MKSTVFLAATFLFRFAVVAQNKKQAPSSWGHYKKLETFSTEGVKGMEAFNTLRFVLATGDTKVEHIERSVSAVNAPAREGKKAAPESKCDPAACQPGDLIGNGRKRETFYLATTEKFLIADPPACLPACTKVTVQY